jgi:hypothetical protein
MISTKTFSPEDLASLSGLTVPTIMYWIRKKKLKAKKVRGYQISAADVAAFLLAQAATKRKTVD